MPVIWRKGTFGTGGPTKAHTMTATPKSAAPPSISSVSPTSYNGGSGTSFTINGSNFTGDAAIKFIDSSSIEYSAASVTVVSATQITATTPQAFTVAQGPLSIRVSQATGTANILNAVTCGVAPSWVTAAGSIGGTIYKNGSVNVSVSATDSDAGSSITYSVYSGSLPSGLSLNSGTGAITGTAPSVGSDTTYNFTIRATDNGGNTADRAFSMVVLLGVPGAPTIGTATATGSTSATVDFTAPASAGGSSITSYTAVSNPGGITATLSQAGSGTITVTGLTASTSYTFTVYATNSYGNSVSSSASNSITTSAAAPATSGKLYTWGANGSGQLGLGNTTSYSSPVQVGALTTWKKSSSANTAMGAIKSDGTLWMWGAGNTGRLGLGNTTYYSSPKQVGALTDWDSISVPTFSGGPLAVKTDGTMWTWGDNSLGLSGLNNKTTYSSPKQIGSLTTWSKVSKNRYNGAAIKTDGTLWTWGANQSGAIGNGTSGGANGKSSPVQVGALTNWSSVSIGDKFMVATKTNGTLWAWGYNGYGALGTGNNTSYSSPVQIGALTDWQSVSTNASHVLAVKTDGTLWAWGGQGNGILGNGSNFGSVNSPTQIGALTNWLAVAAGKYSSAAKKTNGTLWVWGKNSSGQLGLGNTTSYSSPVQVGSLTTWFALPDHFGDTFSGAILA